MFLLPVHRPQLKRVLSALVSRACAIHFACGLCALFVIRNGVAGPVVANSSFETPRLGPCPALAYKPPAAEWTFVSGGLTTAGCGQRFNAPSPPSGGGSQVAFIQNGSASQTVAGFEIGRKYQITFYAAGRTARSRLQRQLHGAQLFRVRWHQ